MRSATPPAEATPPLPANSEPAGEPSSLALFHTLAAHLETTGTHIAYGDLGDLPGDASWNAATHTLTLRDTANTDNRTWALSEFCRRIHLGPDFSHFTTTPTQRHLRAVT